MVDVATDFCAATFQKMQSSKEIWHVIQLMWTLVFIGPPVFLSVDEGSAYVHREMQQNLEATGVRLLQAPV